MWELVAVSVTWWLVSLTGVMAPGPVSAVAVGEGARRGLAAGPLVTAGHAGAELVMVGLLAVGFDRTLREPAVTVVVGVLGGVVLVWMGWSHIRSARSRSSEVKSGRPVAGFGTAGVVWAGVLATVGNPYWLLWWGTVGASYYLLFSRYGPGAVIGLFFLGHIALDLAWTSLLAGVVGAGRGRFPETAYRLLLVGCGLFLVGLGGLFLSNGLRQVARWP